MTPRSYITRARVTAIADQLNAKDRSILADVARLNVASAAQLRRLHGDDSVTGRRRVRGQLERLTADRVLARLERRVGGERAGSDGFVYALDTVGQRIVYPDWRSYRTPWTPQPMHLRHALAVTQLYVDLNLAELAGVRLKRFDAEPACWRSFHGPGGARLTLKPDAFVILAGPDYQDRMFVEIDRSTESLPRIITKGRTYIHYFESGREQGHHGVFPIVVWIAPHDRRRAQLIDALSKLPPEHWRLFVVTTDNHAVDQLIAGTFASLDDHVQDAS